MRSLLRPLLLILPLLGMAHADPVAPAPAKPAGRAQGYRVAKRQAQALLRGAPGGELSGGAYGYVADNGNVIIHSAPRGAQALAQHGPGQTKRLFSPDEHGRIEVANTFVRFKNGRELTTSQSGWERLEHSLWRQDSTGRQYRQHRDARGQFLPRAPR